jgi:hypothetical protein
VSSNSAIPLPDGTTIQLTRIEADRIGKQYGEKVDPDEIIPVNRKHNPLVPHHWSRHVKRSDAKLARFSRHRHGSRRTFCLTLLAMYFVATTNTCFKPAVIDSI